MSNDVITNPSGVITNPVLLAQAGRDALINYEFVLEAPWKACRLCGSVYQSHYDRLAYKFSMSGVFEAASHYNKLGEQRRQRWERIHNRRAHPNYNTELRQLNASGMFLTPEAAQKLSTYGIIHMGETPYVDEVDMALIEAPRAPSDDPGSGGS